jgi:hypothetical protein
VLDGTDLNSGAPLMIDADEVVLEDLAVAHASSEPGSARRTATASTRSAPAACRSRG